MSNDDDVLLNDRANAALIALLRQNGRSPIATLAKRMGLSRSSVYARLARLEKNGTIRGYTVLLAERYEQRRIQAYVMIKVSPRLSRAVERQLVTMPAMTSLHAISGAFDMMAMIEANSVQQLNALIDDIGALEGVENTSSSILLATKLAR